MSEHRKIKDLTLFEEPEVSKPKESFEKKEEISSDTDEHSFYSEKNKDNKFKKLWKGNKIFKHSLIWGTILAIGLSVGLGVGLGVNWSKSRSFIDFPYAPSEEELNEWLDERIDATDIRINRLSDASILYIAETLSEEKAWNGDNHEFSVFPYYEYWLSTAERSADNEISSEKDDYRRNYGGLWSKEWTKNLITQGFDTEEEYRDSKISEEIYKRLENLFTGANRISNVNEGEKEKYKYISTINSSSGTGGTYRAISNSFENNQINIEPFYELYLKSEKPVAISSLDLQWTFKGGEGTYSDLDGVAINFELADESFIRTFDILRAIYNGDNSSEEFNGDWIERELNESPAEITRLGSSGFLGDDPISNNLLNTLFNGGSTVENTTTLDAEEFGQTLHEAIKTAEKIANPDSLNPWEDNINDVQTDDFALLTTETIQQTGNRFYENITGQQSSSAPIQFKNELNKGTASTNPDSRGRAIGRTIDIKAENGSLNEGTPSYKYNKYLLSFTTNGASLTKVFGHDDPSIHLTSESLYALATSENKDNVNLGYTEHDLNKLANSENPINEEYPDFGVLTDFESWITSNLRTLVLNEALTYPEFVEEHIEDDEDMNNIIKNMYYYLDLNGYRGRHEMYFKYINYIEDNSFVYKESTITEQNDLKEAIEEQIKYFTFNDSKIDYKPLTLMEILNNDGDLTKGGGS